MRLVVAGIVAALVAASPAAALQGVIERAATALQRDPVYVAQDAELKPKDADALRAKISSSGAAPAYIAFLPASATQETGGDANGVLRRLHDDLGRPGTYAVVVGKSFRAGSTNLPTGEAARFADAAFAAHRDDGVDAVLSDFLVRVGEADRSARGRGGSGEGGGTGGGGRSAWPVFVVFAAALAGFFWWRRRKRDQAARAQLEQVRETAEEDLVALADDVTALERDVDAARDPGARADYDAALEHYDRANRAFARVRRVEELGPIAETVADGRYLMARARARLEGRPLPERRPPCFFDPRHGPSTRDVEWAPPDGAPRLVPACEADALRVERGLDPQAREVTVGGARVPYWQAPAMLPWFGGYYGGFGFGGFLPGLLVGELLGGGIFAPVAYGGDGGSFGDDGGGFGDLGGGDFGGGDFGGGDFGGGDFGGGDF